MIYSKCWMGGGEENLPNKKHPPRLIIWQVEKWVLANLRRLKSLNVWYADQKNLTTTLFKLKTNNRRKTGKYKKCGDKTTHSSITNGSKKESKGKRKLFKILKQVESQHNKTYKM